MGQPAMTTQCGWHHDHNLAGQRPPDEARLVPPERSVYATSALNERDPMKNQWHERLVFKRNPEFRIKGLYQADTSAPASSA